MHHTGNVYLVRMSPSSRRAWIEIHPLLLRLQQVIVALLAEGVDRNCDFIVSYFSKKVSPSSRRAWIEIHPLLLRLQQVIVALLAEGVDRNCDFIVSYFSKKVSPSSRRAWIEIGLKPMAQPKQ